MVFTVSAGSACLSLCRQTSPVFNEVGHVPAGLANWTLCDFQLYRVNPPLPRMLATLPLLGLDLQYDWSNYPSSPLIREEIPMGIRFLNANGARGLHAFCVARMMMLPFYLGCGIVCYQWARELWGELAGARRRLGNFPLTLRYRIP